MSAILSADALNDFITPGVACIKPVETLPQLDSTSSSQQNPYEVTTEEQVAATEAKLQAAQISLTDCLACSGCVTSAEAVLVSLQSHLEVLSVLDSTSSSLNNDVPSNVRRVFVASISPQSKASLAAATGKSSQQIGHMIDKLLLDAISISGKRAFDYVIDTSSLLSVCRQLAFMEVQGTMAPSTPRSDDMLKLPILTSECPGFICYLEKTHPEILPHLSRLKSPQALLGTLLKSLLPRYLGESTQVYHVAVMPCFDKKLEASRSELTDETWRQTTDSSPPQRDVDCVITTRELVQLAEARGVEFAALSSTPMNDKPLIPIPALQSLMQSHCSTLGPKWGLGSASGTSGGYLADILHKFQQKNPGSIMEERQGRNSDVTEFFLFGSDGKTEILKMARYYGFRNIQNLVRRLKPPKLRQLPGGTTKLTATRVPRSSAMRTGSLSKGGDYCYVEVMACPGGCTNGGGQLRSDDSLLPTLGAGSPNTGMLINGKSDPKAWLARVDEAYFSAEEEEEDIDIGKTGKSASYIDTFLQSWVAETGVLLSKLVYTSYNAVDSDIGKPAGDMTTAQAAELAQKVGGGW